MTTTNSREVEKIVDDWLKTERKDNYVDTGYGLDQVCLDGEFNLNELIDSFNLLLQKARHDWLREEIVKLEGMKLEIPTYLNKRGHHTNSAHRKIRYNKAIQTIIDRYQAELNSK